MERPTYSEHWHRVSPLRIRLRTDAQATRQRARGERWWVVRDPGTNEFVRMSEPAWGLVALLDGKRTVGEAWEVVCERFGDAAPTQGEAMRALGQLYSSNLLVSELPGDARALLARLGQRRRRRAVQGLMGFLFVRIPLFDPNDLLKRWERVGGLAFTWGGFAVWCVLMVLGLGALVSEWERFVSGVWGVLETGNLVWLYGAIAGAKLLHELGHGFACRRFGRVEGIGGEVHTLGVMFLVFVPLPYVDASTAWGLRSKWRRAAVGAAGMYVELGLAAVSAVVWSQTSGGLVNAIAYNLVFAAGVTTVLFNANPLMRYDGYYILSDLLETANLQQRGNRELQHWVKRIAWGVRGSVGAARTSGERVVLLMYACLSGPYRVFLGLVIALFVAETLPFVGIAIALATLVVFLVVPLARFAGYLLTSNELDRVRGRAVGTTLLAGGVIMVGLLVVPAARSVGLDAEVMARERIAVHAREGGFVEWVRVSGEEVGAGEELIRLENRWLEEEWAGVEGELKMARAEYGRALAEDAAAAAIVSGRVRALEDRARSLAERRTSLKIRAEGDGLWFAPDVERALQGYTPRGEELGVVLSVDDVVLRGEVAQVDVGAIADVLGGRGELPVRVRFRARSGEVFRGSLVELAPAGVVGGEGEDGSAGGMEERRFGVSIEMGEAAPEWVRVGMGARVRVDVGREPLGVQWSRRLWQLLQRRLGGAAI